MMLKYMLDVVRVLSVGLVERGALQIAADTFGVLLK